MTDSDRNERLDSLLGAYALDAVTEAERDEIEAYLHLEPRARAEVVEHQEIAALLAQGTTDAPGELWERIASALDAHADRPEPTGELSKVLRLDPARPRQASRRVSRRFIAGLSVAAAAAVLVAGLAMFTGGGEGDMLASALERYTAVRDAPTSQVATLRSDDGTLAADVAVDPSGNGYLDARRLPDLPAEQTYQLWAIDGGAPVSLGVLGARPTIAAFNTANDPALLAITIEPAVGSPQPTSDPIAVAELP